MAGYATKHVRNRLNVESMISAFQNIQNFVQGPLQLEDIPSERSTDPRNIWSKNWQKRLIKKKHAYMACFLHLLVK